MYLSKITYSPDHRAAMVKQLTQNRNLFHEHKMIWNLMPKDAQAKRDFLYLRDDSNTFPFYYLLSKRQPGDVPEYLQVQSKEFSPKLNAGDRCHFTLRANAVVTRKTNSNNNKRLRRDIIESKADQYKQQFPNPADRPSSAIIHNEAGQEWLQKRGETCGFKVSELLVSNHQFHDTKKPSDKNSRHFTSLDFQGRLEITDSDLFLKQLYFGEPSENQSTEINRGLGRSKAFGCGLMLIRKM